MICALVCLSIVTTLVFMIAKNASTTRRETRLRLQVLQTERLLDAGILRSRIAHNRDNDYEGETWKPRLKIGEFDISTEVTISTTRLSSTEDEINIIARLGVPPQQTQQSYTYVASTEQ